MCHSFFSLYLLCSVQCILGAFHFSRHGFVRSNFHPAVVNGVLQPLCKYRQFRGAGKEASAQTVENGGKLPVNPLFWKCGNDKMHVLRPEFQWYLCGCLTMESPLPMEARLSFPRFRGEVCTMGCRGGTHTMPYACGMRATPCPGAIAHSALA